MKALDFDTLDNLNNKLDGINAGLNCIALSLDANGDAVSAKAVYYFAQELMAAQKALAQTYAKQGVKDE